MKVRAQLNLFCIGLGNHKCQLVAIQRDYKTGKVKVCLKRPWFAKSCQKGCARPVTKYLIYQFWGAKRPSSEKIRGNAECR